MALSEIAVLDHGNPPGDFTEKAGDILRLVVPAYPDGLFANLEYLAHSVGNGHGGTMHAYPAAVDAHPGDPRFVLFFAASRTLQAPGRLHGRTDAADLAGEVEPFLKGRD